MSTFGEINEPSSRNVWEDWDEINHAENSIQLNWQNVMDEPNHIGTLLILEGKYLSDSVSLSRNVDLINCETHFNLRLYKVKTSNDFVCILKDYDLVLSSDIVNLLKSYIAVSDDVVAILTKPLVEFHSSGDNLQDCTVRRLSTNVQSNSIVMKYPKLEQPNILAGVSAGAICMREVLDLPATAVVFYIEQPEDNELSELCKLLLNLNILMEKQKPSSILDSNLYI